MPQFRKKPVVVDAVLWTGCNYADLELLQLDAAPGTELVFEVGKATVQIPTLEGVMEARPGDYVIRGVKGELYPCKADVFAATYEPAG